MKVVAIISQKGGAGKTTLATNLAVAASLKEKNVVIIDLDPQVSSAEWADNRQNEQPSVVSAQAARLGPVLKTAEEQGVEIVFIDTAPHSQNDALLAAKAADLILIPCRPSGFDLRAVRLSFNLVELTAKKVFAVINAAPVQGSLAEEADEAIKESFKIDVAPQKISNRISFIYAGGMGLSVVEYEPKGKAAEEINALYEWLSLTLDQIAN